MELTSEAAEENVTFSMGWAMLDGSCCDTRGTPSMGLLTLSNHLFPLQCKKVWCAMDCAMDCMTHPHPHNSF